MTSHDRKEAEDQLTAILNRALKNVPLVKLDAVDEVIKLFTEAIDMMEANQSIDDDDRHSSMPIGLNESRQSALLALAGGTPSTATTANSSSASSATSSDTELDSFRPPVNKAVAGLSSLVTVDYSSPSSQRRTLAKPGAAKEAPRPAGNQPILGLGGNKSGSGTSKPGLGLGGAGGEKKLSSRATTTMSALHSGNGSPVSPTTPDGESDQPVLKNKLVSNIASAPSSREYPSPKLGPRSLGGNKPAPVSVPQPTMSLPTADSLGRDAGVPAVPVSGTASPDADDEALDEPDETEAGDLILTDKKNNVFNRVKSTLPVTASPKQIRSSFHLLELATTQSIGQDDDDLTLKGQTNVNANGIPTDRPAGTTGVLSALPTGIQAASTNSTPKPSYLRRLDSPDTHHGQLLAAKSRLQLLLNKGIQLADRVNLAAVPEIKAKLEAALVKLEASLVQATIGPQ